MTALRTLGFLALGGLVVAGSGFATLRLLEHVDARRSAAASSTETADAAEDSEPARTIDDSSEEADDLEASAGAPTTVGDAGPPEPTASPFWGHCCITRKHRDAEQLRAAQRELGKRWPKLLTTEHEQIDAHDRVGFLVEVGSKPSAFAHELLTGTVAAVEGEHLIVGLDCEPRQRCRHGLCCEGLTLVARDAVIAWTGAEDPEFAGELAVPVDGALVRRVAVGEPIELAAREHPGARWSVDPAGAAEVEEIERRDGSVTVRLRQARRGSLTLKLTADHELWGELLLGAWPLEVAVDSASTGWAATSDVEPISTRADDQAATSAGASVHFLGALTDAGVGS